MMMFSRGIYRSPLSVIRYPWCITDNGRRMTSYFKILVATPAPTVRPPSRIANRSCSSIAIGVISSIVIFVLSPGITISTPAASSTLPVTSVVRRQNCGRYPLKNSLSPPPPFLAHLHLPALDPPRRHRPPPRDREHVLHRHQERLLHLPLRHRNALVQRRQQLVHLAHPRLVPRDRLQRRPPDHRDVVPRILVLRQELPHLQLHQVQQLRVVHQVALIEKHDDRRHVHLARQQDVLPRLRHRPIHRRHHQDRPVHLRRPRDHVLHVVGVARAVHVRVVAVCPGGIHVGGGGGGGLWVGPPPPRPPR